MKYLAAATQNVAGQQGEVTVSLLFFLAVSTRHLDAEYLKKKLHSDL